MKPSQPLASGLPRNLAWRIALRSRLLDAILRRRARGIMRAAQLDRHLPDAGLLLDLGSGLGHLAEALPRRPGRRCIGIDPVWSPPPLLARRLAAGGPGFLRADGTALPFPAGCLDGAWCAFVLHHLAPEGQQTLLAEAARVLRPGAPFILIEDTPANDATLRADRRLNWEPHAAPHHYRSPREWQDALAAAGLTPCLEIAFTAIFPRATLRRVPHRAFICHRAG